ncbi:hypothetical protein RSAG8_13028, partial [Rhizoctonia solani AG-8 WAC10335]
MESSSIGGSAALTLCHQTKTQLVKSRVRRAMLMSCRTAVTSVAEDGSPPMVTDRLDIGMVEYKNYINFVKENKVIMEGWPVKPDGSLVDPSSMGLGKLEKLLKLLENPSSGCGFKRLSENEWKEWTEKLDQEIVAGKIKLPTRKTRSDAGKKRKRDTHVEGDEADVSMAERKKNTKPKSKKASAPKARGSQATKQKKSSASNRSPSSDSLQAANPDAISDHLSHAANPSQPTGVQDVTSADQHDNLPMPTEMMRTSPLVDSTPNTQTTFNFEFGAVDPTAPQWPANTPPRTSTPQASQIGLKPSAIAARGSPRSGPGTPKRDYRFVVSTPEQQAARANSPRRLRSRSPAMPCTPTVSRTHPIPRNPVVDIPIDPRLLSARIDLGNITSK